MILGLDLSSVNSGYALISLQTKSGGQASYLECCKEEVVETIEEYGNIKPGKKMNSMEKILYIYESILDILKEKDVDAMVIEDQYFGRNAKTGKLLSRICGAAIIAGVQFGCKVEIYTASRVKKHFSGKGNASKKLMIESAKTRYGIDDIDDNVADAIGVGFTYIERFIRGAKS